jgi:hypothetical protein
VEFSLLDTTRDLGRLGLATLLRCIVLRIVGLLALETERVVHTAGSSSDVLEAALLLAPPASTMRLAVWRAACLRCLGAAQVLAAPAAAMQRAVLRVTESRLGAALVLAAIAPAMRDTVQRATCNS